MALRIWLTLDDSALGLWLADPGLIGQASRLDSLQSNPLSFQHFIPRELFQLPDILCCSFKAENWYNSLFKVSQFGGISLVIITHWLKDWPEVCWLLYMYQRSPEHTHTHGCMFTHLSLTIEDTD